MKAGLNSGPESVDMPFMEVPPQTIQLREMLQMHYVTCRLDVACLMEEWWKSFETTEEVYTAMVTLREQVGVKINDKQIDIILLTNEFVLVITHAHTTLYAL